MSFHSSRAGSDFSGGLFFSLQVWGDLEVKKELAVLVDRRCVHGDGTLGAGARNIYSSTAKYSPTPFPVFVTHGNTVRY